MNINTQTTSKPAPMEQLIELLSKKHAGLFDDLQRLESKLSPALSPSDPPLPTTAALARESECQGSSPLAIRLASAIHEVDRITGYVVQIARRVEV